MMVKWSSRFLAFVGCILLLGCGGDGAGDWTLEVTTNLSGGGQSKMTLYDVEKPDTEESFCNAKAVQDTAAMEDTSIDSCSFDGTTGHITSTTRGVEQQSTYRYFK